MNNGAMTGAASRMPLSRVCAAVITGGLLAVLLSFSPAVFFMLTLAAATAFLLYCFSGKNDRRFILFIFLAALGTRVIVLLSLMGWSLFSGHILNYALLGAPCPNISTPYIIGDSGYYTLRAMFTNMYWQGMPLETYTIEGLVHHHYALNGFIYVLASFFGIFGYSPIASRLINCFFGALIPVLIYSTVRTIFNSKPARLAAVLTAFFPSLFFWSVTNLKETSITFFFCLMLWAAIKYQKSRKKYYFPMIALFVWLQGYLRESFKNEFFLISAVVMLAYILFLLAEKMSRSKKLTIFLAILVIAGSAAFHYRAVINSVFEEQLAYLFARHRGVVGAGGVCYRTLPVYFYTGSHHLTVTHLLQMLGRGWFHIMLEPLPSRMRISKSMLYVFPQMLCWYLLIPFAVIGMILSFRYRARQSIILFIYFFTIGSALALTEGNIGTVFRHRDVITPLFLLFASVGLVKVCARNFSLDEEK